MELKFKKLTEQATTPVRAHATDAGIDLTVLSIEPVQNECGQLMLRYHTGLAVEIPEGYVGLLFPRSSIYKKSLAMTNSVGVIDSGYRGEIMVVMHTTTDVVPAIYKPGDRFCQLVIVPNPVFDVNVVEELNESDRGEGGFGSTGATINDVEQPTEQVETQANATTVTEPAESIEEVATASENEAKAEE
jgi:dUTP pyrophosphatase